MAFNFLSFCNNEPDNTTTRNTARYSKVDESVLADKNEEIARLKEELNEEQERADELQEENETLTKQIKNLRQQLNQYIHENNEVREIQYDQAKLEQLLQDKQAQLARVEDDYAKSQEKLKSLRDQLEQSKHLLTTETMAHQVLQKQMEQIKTIHDTTIQSYKAQLDQQLQQFEDLQKKYRDIETQRNELLAQSQAESAEDDASKDIILHQLEDYQMKCKEKNDKIAELQRKLVTLENVQKNDTSKEEISALQQQLTSLNQENQTLRDKQEEMKEQLADETRRADGMQDLLENKSLEIVRLKEELEKLQKENNNLKIHQLENIEQKDESNEAKFSLPPLKPIKFPVEYFVEKLNDYREDETLLLEIWQKVDIHDNHQTQVSPQCLNLILKSFLDLIKITYINEKVDHRGKYDLDAKKAVEIQNLEEVLQGMRIDYQRGALNRSFIKDKQVLSKKQFFSHFINCITDPAYNHKIEQLEQDINIIAVDEEEKDGFDALKYIATGPTVFGADKRTFNAQEYVSKVKEAMNKEVKNDKEKVRNIIDVIIKCNSSQRKEINEHGYTNLSNIFPEFAKNKNVLKLLNLMMKSLSECDAEWLNKAIDKKDEEVVIEILFTRTNQQIQEFTKVYQDKYGKDLSKEIKRAFNAKDEEFVIMCQTLIECKKRNEAGPNEVNKKWANNDAKRIKGYLIDDQNGLNDDKAWNTLCDLVVNRNWCHLNVINNSFQTQTRVSLPYQLKLTAPNRSISRRAVLVALQAASTMHAYFADKLKQSMTASFGGLDNATLHRILISRSELDLADIEHEFTNNSEYGEGKTTRTWIEENTQSSLYQYIILSLLGLSDAQIRDRIGRSPPVTPLPQDNDIKEQFNLDGDKKEEAESEVPEHYRDGLVNWDPSIKEHPSFNATKDALLIQTWMKEFDADKKFKGDKGKLKERLANLLSARNAMQREKIVSKYPNVMEDITKRLKKGHVFNLCDAFLKPSIAFYEATLIQKAQSNNDLNKVGSILCTKNNVEIRQIIAEYKRIYYGADLVRKISDLCEKNKRGSVRIILDSLLQCRRNEKELNVDKQAVSSDVDFLINTKKFGKDEKKRLVEIFCNHNWRYIREINRQYGMRSKSLNLYKLIEKTLGSGSGYFTTVLLKYHLSPSEYFAQKLFELGQKFDKNRDEIGQIFVSRSEIDLNDIRARFAKKQYGKQLDKWIEEKSKKSNFGYFLSQIITSIDKHNKLMKEQEAKMKKEEEAKEESAIQISTTSITNTSVTNGTTPRQTQQQQQQPPPAYQEEPALTDTQSFNPDSAAVIVDHIDSDVDALAETPTATKKSPSSKKPKYNDVEFQQEILNNDTKRDASLATFTSEDGGLIKFLDKYLKSKIVDKMWKKLDPTDKGYIEMTSFPDLLAFVVILYKVKVHQQKTKSKTKPEMDNKAVRGECEHIAIWIAKTYVYNEDNQFKLFREDFQNQLPSWCQEYVDVDGVLMDF